MRHLIYSLVLATFGSPVLAEMTLVMAEEQGCVWCERWNADIGPIYPKSAEGQAAPLRRIDVNDPMPSDLSFTSTPRFTPTFVLMDDGTEIGRIEGYPGEDFFWGLLGVLLEQADTTPKTNE
tara:strand:- start:30063 stop:30428 length:366 start_codon:yes stop_codon:yes gene_type:complete